MEDETLYKLHENIERLNQNIERQTSLKFLIFSGLVSGICFVIGTTILAGIIISILTQTFGSIENIPILRDMVELNSHSLEMLF